MINPQRRDAVPSKRKAKNIIVSPFFINHTPDSKVCIDIGFDFITFSFTPVSVYYIAGNLFFEALQVPVI